MQSTKVTVRRPSGQIEEVIKQGVTITDMATRRAAEKATRDAGRGDIISWEIIGKPYTGPIIDARRLAASANYAHSGRCCSYWTRDQGCPLHGDA